MNIFLPSVITVIMCLLEAFCLYRLISRTLTSRFSSHHGVWYYIPVCACYLSYEFLRPYVTGVPLKLILHTTIYLSVLFFHRDSIIRKIYIIVVNFFLLLVCELAVILAALLCSPISHQEIVDNVYLAQSLTFISRMIYLWIIGKLFAQKQDSNRFEEFLKEIFWLLAIDALYALIVCSLFFYDNTFLDIQTAIALSFLTILLITVLVCLTIYKISKKSKEMMETNLKLQQAEMENQLNKDMTLVVENLRSLRHDMNNHLSVLNGLISMQEYEDAQSYLSSVTEELKVANNFLFIDNKALSVLLNSKITKAHEKGITVDTEIHNSNTPFSDKDLCVVVGNLLENAIEAAAGHPSPYIFFSIRKKKDQIHILCENSYTTQPIFQNGQLVTTKKDKSYHGIGTRNICSITESYHGTVSFTVDEQFHAHIIVPV